MSWSDGLIPRIGARLHILLEQECAQVVHRSIIVLEKFLELGPYHTKGLLDKWVDAILGKIASQLEEIPEPVEAHQQGLVVLELVQERGEQSYHVPALEEGEDDLLLCCVCEIKQDPPHLPSDTQLVCFHHPEEPVHEVLVPYEELGVLLLPPCDVGDHPASLLPDIGIVVAQQQFYLGQCPTLHHVLAFFVVA